MIYYKYHLDELQRKVFEVLLGTYKKIDVPWSHMTILKYRVKDRSDLSSPGRSFRGQK